MLILLFRVPIYNFFYRRRIINMKLPIISTNGGYFNIVLCQLVFHELLEDFHHEVFGFLQGHVTMIPLRENSPSPFCATAYSLSIVACVGAAWVRLPKLRARLVDAANQKGNTKGAGHELFLTAALTKLNGKIAGCKGTRFYRHGFVVGETVVLSLHPRMLDENTGISDHTTHHSCNVVIDFKNFINTGGNHQCGRNALLGCQHHTLRSSDA
ncbi:20S proteasome subunit alpha 5 [Strigomonas culicis]|uniref:20S proteasome subunit alpha 5 n=1 Tax=Strigomonas culicis TaxID=28005 RepID=S9W1J1_9TRYP|nr:20S proteasome subunit alpha 5 [Strigomonas culicis]|eukprot:EPY29640.1 20S proteasome subunit alpha 5 [Strigomonas culicis]